MPDVGAMMGDCGMYFVWYDGDKSNGSRDCLDVSVFGIEMFGQREEREKNEMVELLTVGFNMMERINPTMAQWLCSAGDAVDAGRNRGIFSGKEINQCQDPPKTMSYHV